MNCNEVDDRLEEYLEGALKLVEAQQIEGHLQECATCQKSLRAAQAVADELKGVQRRQCPPHVTRLVFDSLPPLVRLPRVRWDQVGEWLRPMPWRLALASGAVALAVLLYFRSPGIKESVETRAGYTVQDIDRARRQLELAISILAKSSQRPAELLQHDIIPARVIRPVQMGLELAMQGDKPGVKQ